MVAVGGLPIIPDLSCPSSALSLGASGLGPACQVASGVKGAVGSAASSLVGFGADSVLNVLGGWVSAGATWLLGQIGAVIADTTTIDLGASWFTAHYQVMVVLAGVVIVPMLLIGIMQSIYRQDASALLRSVLVNVPLAILLTAVAVKLVQLGLAVTDAMSAAVSRGAGLDSGHFLSTVTLGLSATSATGQPTAPAFVLFVGGLAVVFGALMVWVELLIRAAAVYVAVLFLPLALASLAWPAIAHWCRRLVDTLVALVLGKFVIVSVLSLAAGALAGGTGSGSSGSPSSPGAGHSGGGGFAAVLGGAALLLFAAFAPWALFRLLPFLESGAVGHLESFSHRAHQSAGAPARGLARTAMQATGAGSVAGAASGSVGGLVGGLGRAGLGGAGLGRSGGLGGRGRLGGLGGGLAGPESGPGGDGPPGTRPDPGPSSAESTGVGTTEPPGRGIPAWAIHPKATATARRSSGAHGEGSRAGASESGGRPSLGAGPDPSAPFGGVGTSGSPGPGGSSAVASADGDPGYVKQLPRPMGTNLTDTLGRDHLGVRLISRTIESEALGRPVTPPQKGPTGPGTGDGT